MLIVQINPFRPNPIHPETGSYYFRISSQIFSQSGLAGGGGDFFYHEGLKPLSAGLKTQFVCLCAHARVTPCMSNICHI